MQWSWLMLQSTWSTNIYEIHKGGLYADSVLLKCVFTPRL
eukprot:SAG31_NODE_29196_length_399_cov_0.873333_1_plen_39_part_01